MTRFNNTSCQNPYARTAAMQEYLETWRKKQEEYFQSLMQTEEEFLENATWLDDYPDDSEAEGLYRFVETPDGGYYERRI